MALQAGHHATASALYAPAEALVISPAGLHERPQSGSHLGCDLSLGHGDVSACGHRECHERYRNSATSLSADDHAVLLQKMMLRPNPRFKPCRGSESGQVGSGMMHRQDRHRLIGQYRFLSIGQWRVTVCKCRLSGCGRNRMIRQECGARLDPCRLRAWRDRRVRDRARRAARPLYFYLNVEIPRLRRASRRTRDFLIPFAPARDPLSFALSGPKPNNRRG